MASIGLRITDLIGSDYDDIPSNSYNDLINSAINEVADSLPNELLLKYCHYATDILSSDGMDATEEKKVLLVTRRISDSGTELRECTAVPYHQFEMAQDTNSIYLATIESPIYTYDVNTVTDPKLKVFPVPTSGQRSTVWHFNYATGDNSGSSSINGLPDMCLQAVVFRACVNILQAYISDFVQDEEDSEMQTMLNTQMQSLQGAYTLEMQRFTETDKQPRGE